MIKAKDIERDEPIDLMVIAIYQICINYVFNSYDI